MTPRKKQQTRGQCIGTMCTINVAMLVANILMPLPTGLTPVLIAILVVDLCAFPIIFMTKKPAGSSSTESHTGDSQNAGTQITCSKCFKNQDNDHEHCIACGHPLN